VEVTTAFVRSVDDGRIDIVVNFGLLAGREATLAEVDRLARRLLEDAERVTINSNRRHEVTHAEETIVHQVLVDAKAPGALASELRDRCEAWAVECADERRLEPLGP